MNKLLRLMSILMLLVMMITAIPPGGYTVLADGVDPTTAQLVDPTSTPPQQPGDPTTTDILNTLVSESPFTSNINTFLRNFRATDGVIDFGSAAALRGALGQTNTGTVYSPQGSSGAILLNPVVFAGLQPEFGAATLVHEGQHVWDNTYVLPLWEADPSVIPINYCWYTEYRAFTTGANAWEDLKTHLPPREDLSANGQIIYDFNERNLTDLGNLYSPDLETRIQAISSLYSYFHGYSTHAQDGGPCPGNPPPLTAENIATPSAAIVESQQ